MKRNNTEMAAMNNPIDGRQDRAEDRSAPNFMRLFGQMVMLPFTVFVQGMELFFKTIQGIQKATDEGMDVMVGEIKQTAETASGSGIEQVPKTTSFATGGVIESDAAITLKEKINMSDTDLSGKNTLKLVRYKILFIKRDYETAFPEVEELVADSMDDNAYTAWKVAEFIQRLGKHKTLVPTKWGQKYPPKEYRNGDILLGFPEEDKKYLRVYFEVLARYDREEFKYHERQIEVLEEIRDKLA
jgi:hypothetical protein